jgi:acylphosphatase
LIRAVCIKVSGRVQGVFFRKYTKDEAQRLTLSGQVSNLGDGSVEIHARGESGKIEALIRWCHKGSPMSSVSEVVTTEIDPSSITKPSFEIVY